MYSTLSPVRTVPIVAEGQLIVEIGIESLPPMTWCCSTGSPAQIDAPQFPATMGDLGGAVAEVGPNVKELSRRL
jgi:hypothetical protein